MGFTLKKFGLVVNLFLTLNGGLTPNQTFFIMTRTIKN